MLADRVLADRVLAGASSFTKEVRRWGSLRENKYTLIGRPLSG